MIKQIALLVFSVLLSIWSSSFAANTFPSSGDVGIGTSSPSELLHVEGTYGTGLRVGNGATNLAFRSYTGGLTGIPGSNFGMQITGPGASHIVMDLMANDGSDGFYVRIPTTLEANPTIDKVAFSVKANGFVGVGTTNPPGLISVYNNTDNAAATAASFQTRRNNSQIYLKLQNLSYTGGSDIFMFADYLGSVGFHQVGVGNTFVLHQNSNVGIGTTTPDYKLDVKGTIRAEEVIVETGWSDFVFEDDYKLPTLDEVSSFIDENGHLPGVPSAAEVEANGVTLGQMNSKLLQKVEELTLYTLKQQLELEELKSQNLKLISRLEAAGL